MMNFLAEKKELRAKAKKIEINASKDLLGGLPNPGLI